MWQLPPAINAIWLAGVLLVSSGLGQATADITTGLVACWHFDETAGASTAADACGGFTGTLTNMTPATDWVPGKLGNALNFDGTDGHVVTSISATLNPPAITLAAWIKLDTIGPSTYRTIITRANAGNTLYYQLTINNNGKVAAYITTGGGGDFGYDGSGIHTLTTGTWYHIAFTYNNSVGFVGYVNAVQDQTGLPQAPLDSIPSVPTVIGQNPPGLTDPFDGLLDEVYLFSRALSASDIAELYALTSAAPRRRPLVFQ